MFSGTLEALSWSLLRLNFMYLPVWSIFSRLHIGKRVKSHAFFNWDLRLLIPVRNCYIAICGEMSVQIATKLDDWCSIVNPFTGTYSRGSKLRRKSCCIIGEWSTSMLHLDTRFLRPSIVSNDRLLLGCFYWPIQNLNLYVCIEGRLQSSNESPFIAPPKGLGAAWYEFT